MDIGTFWTRITILCHRFNMRVTSGPRSIAWNQTLGGVSYSFHLSGLGADCDGYRNEDRTAIKQAANSLGLWVKDEGDHLHFQPLSLTKGKEP